MPADRPEWTTRVWREFRAGNLTRAYRDVLLTLRTFRGSGGVCTPSHATLADRAGCSASTVLRTLQQALRLGLVSWAERRMRAGWRWLRNSNAYTFPPVPDGPVRPGLRPRMRWRRTNQQNAGGGERTSKKEAWEGMKRAAARLPGPPCDTAGRWSKGG